MNLYVDFIHNKDSSRLEINSESIFCFLEPCRTKRFEMVVKHSIKETCEVYRFFDFYHISEIAHFPQTEKDFDDIFVKLNQTKSMSYYLKDENKTPIAGRKDNLQKSGKQVAEDEIDPAADLPMIEYIFYKFKEFMSNLVLKEPKTFVVFVGGCLMTLILTICLIDKMRTEKEPELIRRIKMMNSEKNKDNEFNENYL
ncbi:hypothetical protein RF11_12757 [Thelohanellus kitauei]|uniref:Uncharacterized protein n=1 Tax=Thelohanellus kitauei TaxID=669202 RepID=A0A0C2I7X3_THEKT|nr:hypothetical protein RF11_12757 [Thelohanellus kitauei]